MEEYGCPNNIRVDFGGENIRVAAYVVRKRGLDHAKFGTSCHNSRIERFWRDVRKDVLNYWRTLFSYFSDNGVDFQNANIIFCVHYLFLSAINYDLEQFRQAWNYHPMRTQNYR